jgi:hypothetical protein
MSAKQHMHKSQMARVYIIEKRITGEQSRNTKEKKLRTRTHTDFTWETLKGKKTHGRCQNSFLLVLKVQLHQNYIGDYIYIYIYKQTHKP